MFQNITCWVLIYRNQAWKVIEKSLNLIEMKVLER